MGHKISRDYIQVLHLGLFLALRCFACTYTTSADQLCIDDPISVQGQSIVPCDKKYCTILRQESVNPAGKVVSFARQCEERPDVSKYRSCIVYQNIDFGSDYLT